jgi:DNA adenine methylase
MLSYIGGKSRIGKWIVPFIPKDIETYVEPFSGMYWVYFNMDITQYPNLKKIVYNDFNPLNYNLFKCIQNPAELLKSIDSLSCQQLGVENTPSIFKEQFIQYQKDIFSEGFKTNVPDYLTAAKYVYILTQVFSGSKPETSSFIDLKGKYKSKYLSFKDKLSNPKWVDMFVKITDVENMDFSDVIEKYDNENTFFYTDPPYWKTENYYSNHDFDRNDHERLAESLKSIKGKFALSYYDFDLLNQWFPKDVYKWESKDFSKAAAAKKGKEQSIGTELLILNY